MIRHRVTLPLLYADSARSRWLKYHATVGSAVLAPLCRAYWQHRNPLRLPLAPAQRSTPTQFLRSRAPVSR